MDPPELLPEGNAPHKREIAFQGKANLAWMEEVDSSIFL